MRHLKRDLQRAIEHIICYTLNDISLRTAKIEEFIDKKGNVKPGINDIETSFREALVEDYNHLMQRYTVNLQPLFKYIEVELPQFKKQIEPLKQLYDKILAHGNFKNGCQCHGCKKWRKNDKQRNK